LYDKADINAQYLESLGVKEGNPATPCATPTSSDNVENQSEELGVRRASIAIGLSMMQQLTGVNAVIYYAPHFYTLLGVKANIAILIAGLNSVAQVMMTRIMTLIVDSWGRRCVCLIGLLGMLIGLTMLGLAFNPSCNLPVGFAVGGILIFRLAFSLSLGPLPYIMLTELFPQKYRAKGVATSMATNWLLNWAVVFAIPYLMTDSGGTVFFAFAGMCVVSFVVVDLWLPETARQNLENAGSGDHAHQGVIRKILKRCCREREPSLLGPGPARDPSGTSMQ
jgi:MFS family permease